MTTTAIAVLFVMSFAHLALTGVVVWAIIRIKREQWLRDAGLL